MIADRPHSIRKDLTIFILPDYSYKPFDSISHKLVVNRWLSSTKIG